MAVQILIFIAALAVLLFAARIFTNSAEKLGTWLGMPSFVIGVFIVGIGTSLPELISSIISVQKGVSEIVPGNVIGASIFNMIVVPGLAAIFGPISVPAALLGFSLPFLVGSGLFFYLLTQDKTLSRWEGILCVLLFVLFLLKVTGL